MVRINMVTLGIREASAAFAQTLIESVALFASFSFHDKVCMMCRMVDQKKFL